VISRTLSDLPFPERALSRAAGSSRVDGNRLSLQFEGPVAFDLWLEAIARAERYVHFENYILRDDAVGIRFREALIERARAGVEVRVLYDWVGSWATPRRYWKPFREAGVEVRAFNRPALRDPFGVLQRDHRKLVVVDGEVAFVGGFCVGEEWAGTEDAPPWRDTGVEIRGPGVAEAARTFERIWAEIGEPVPEHLREDPARVAPVGPTTIWLVEGVPWRTRVYRVTQLVAAHARERIWITDPYFVAPRAVRESLAACAQDGVDVRILVPAHNNWPWVGSLSRGGYRFLLEAGVRIFEWGGPMIHAKTAVVDTYWCRVGSSNLNAASLLGNWELDVGVLDPELAGQVAGLFIADLSSSEEIVLPATMRRLSAEARSERIEDLAGKGRMPLGEGDPDLRRRWRSWRRRSDAAQTLTLADLVRASSTLGEAIAGHRVVGREDRAILAALTAALVGSALLAAIFPRTVAWTAAVILGWLGGALTLRGILQYVRARREARAAAARGEGDTE
jgi:cardiolipin synthase A/B